MNGSCGNRRAEPVVIRLVARGCVSVPRATDLAEFHYDTDRKAPTAIPPHSKSLRRPVADNRDIARYTGTRRQFPLSPPPGTNLVVQDSRHYLLTILVAHS